MILLIFWILLGIITGVIAEGKGRSGCGWLFIGILLGPLGIILALVISKNQEVVEKEAIESGEMKRCPYCAELIRAEAIKCRYCGTELKNDN